MQPFIYGLCHRLQDEEGTAITEMAIMLPGILIILFWSIFFSDVSIVRLKVLEASRMALWETTAYRRPGDIKKEVEDRFADLNSGDKLTNVKKPVGFYAISDVKVSVSVNNSIHTQYLGDTNAKNSGGVEGLLGKLGVSLDKGLDKILGYASLNPNGTAESNVSISVKDNIFPGATSILNTDLSTAEVRNALTFSDKKQQLIYDSWKAWPHPGSKVGLTNNNTDVYQTYPAAEQVTAAHVSHLAFLGLAGNSFVGGINKFLSVLRLPSPLSTSSFQADHQGPVAMLPAAPIAESWVPGHGMAPYRVGDRTFNGYNRSGSGFYNPSPGIDRARPTLPYKYASDMWGVGGASSGPLGGNLWGSFGWGADLSNGGYRHQELRSSEALNDYYRSYQCRGHFYDGMVVATGVPAKSSSNYHGCNGSGAFGLGGGLHFPTPTLPSIGGIGSLF